MFRFLNPIALLSFTALAIPVLVHLWHVRKGKTLHIGSIRLFTINNKQNSSSRRIHNWPLFLLRCLFIIMLATLLANPVWTSHQPPPGTGWIIVTGTSTGQAYREYPHTIDSLISKGFSLHQAGEPYSTILLADSNKVNTNSNHTLTTWQLMRELDSRLPAGLPVYIFTGHPLSDYSGNRPSTRLSVDIRSITPTNLRSETSLQPFVTTENKQRTDQWISTSTGNHFRSIDTSISLAAAPDTQLIRIGIVSNAHNDDSYIRAAVNAISSYTKKRSTVINLTPGRPVSQPMDLIFQLNEKESNDTWVKSLTEKGTLFFYASGEKTETPSFLETPLVPLDRSNLIHVSNQRLISAPGKTIWQTGTGRPLLNMEYIGSKKVLHFAFDFDPQSSTLVWDETFVRSLLPILIQPTSSLLPDNRMIDPAQSGNINYNKDNRQQASLISLQQDLKPLWWTIILFVFFAERFLFYHQRGKKTNV
ncbi:MAG: BatA domain-containing protein [Chitinophagaceae bacterium]